MVRRRRSFLINKRFQLRYSFYVCSWIFALSLIYPLIIYNLFDLFLKYIALDPQGPELSRLADVRHKMMQLLVIMQLLFMAVTFLVSVFMSHRIAGPLYKLKMFLMRAKKGDFSTKLSFRKHDHFTELAEAYNEMTAGIQDRVEQALTKVSPSARAELEKALKES